MGAYDRGLESQRRQGRVTSGSLERHGRIHTAPSWMDSRRNVLFACASCDYEENSFVDYHADCHNVGLFIRDQQQRRLL